MQRLVPGGMRLPCEREALLSPRMQVDRLAVETAVRYQRALCEDEDDQCEEHVGSGYCRSGSNYTQYMGRHCPRACDVRTAVRVLF